MKIYLFFHENYKLYILFFHFIYNQSYTAAKTPDSFHLNTDKKDNYYTGGGL